ncbi:hypothetical protein RBR11_07410 [Microbacterium sp. ASV81]|uniref:Uncharacterized protein n=2 Tax=Microbacterium capsulatum TaxID=3041921 RepID=A0ABU0XF56_9MICO|nr:hypothetical protein [Microbacterium sp. ASV81]
MDNIRDFAADAYRVSQDKNDILPTVISDRNTPQEILTVTAYGERLPLALNGSDRQKAVLAALESGNQSVQWQNMNKVVTSDPEGMTGGAVAYQNIISTPELVGATEVATLPNGVKYRDLTVKTADGSNYTSRVYFHTISYGGQSFGWWTQS